MSDANELFGSSSDEDEMEEMRSSQPNSSKVPQQSVNSDITTNRSEPTNELNELFGSDDEADPLGSLPSGNKQPSQKIKSLSNGKLCLANIPKVDPNNVTLLLKVPYFLRIESEPYEADTYNEEEDERKNEIMLKTVIRWRFKTNSLGDVLKDKDGKLIRESNARLVKWSDGTYQVIVGDDWFQGIVVDDPCCFVYGHNKSGPPEDNPEMEVQRVSCLEAVSQVNHRLKLHPSNLGSDVHARISLDIKGRNKKAARIKSRDLDSIEFNPDKEKDIRIQKETRDKKMEKKRSRETARDSGGRRSSFAGLTPSFLEDDNFDSTNISAIKRATTSARRRRSKEDEYEEDEDEEEEEEEEESRWQAEIRKKSSSRRRRAEEEDEDEDDEEEEDEEGNSPVKGRVASSRPKAPLTLPSGVVAAGGVEEEDEDDGGLGTQKKRVRRAVIDSDEDD